MKILGVNFVLPNAAFDFIVFGGLISYGMVLLFSLTTTFWPIILLYLIWIWVIDNKVCERGGRSVQCVRRLVFWKHLRDYFPVLLRKVPDVELDPTRNYLFCCFPHGLLATGVFSAFATTAGGFHKLFPSHKPYILTLKQNFYMPFIRDFLLSIGACAVSEKSINWIVGSSRRGNVAVLVVGGAEESFYCRPGKYHLVLKNRKGFVRLSLRNGSPLVPVFSFGETDIFDQFSNPKGSLLRILQETVKKITGIAPIIPLGRGFFQYSFGLVPRRKPINIIVGKPIDVEQVENPTEEQINALHAKFVNELTKLFEEHKHNYIKNPENVSLVII